MIHVRFEGRSYDFAEQKLGIKGTVADRHLKALVAEHLRVRPERLREYVVDRSPSGDLVVRPEAIYG